MYGNRRRPVCKKSSLIEFYPSARSDTLSLESLTVAGIPGSAKWHKVLVKRRYRKGGPRYDSWPVRQHIEDGRFKARLHSQRDLTVFDGERQAQTHWFCARSRDSEEQTARSILVS